VPKVGWKKMDEREKSIIRAHFEKHLNSKKGVLDTASLAVILGRSVASIGRAAKAMHLTNRYRKPINRIEDRWTVDKNGCWLWLLAVTPAGYAEENWTGGVRVVHRKHYEEKHGKIPDKLVLDHLCRVRRCVNPDHLEAVTDAVNIQRGLSAKITVEDVKFIRASTVPYRELAEKYGLHPKYIGVIKRGQSWRNV
jgi:hypothetical protein